MIILRRKCYSADRDYARAARNPQFFQQLSEQGTKGSGKVYRKVKGILGKSKEFIKNYGKEFKENPIKTVGRRPFTSAGIAVSLAPIPGSSVVGLPAGYLLDEGAKAVYTAARNSSREAAPYLSYIGTAGRVRAPR